MLKSLLLAQAVPLVNQAGSAESSKVYNWSLRDMILVVGVTLILANLLFLWAYFSRRNRRRQYGMYSRALYKNEKGVPGSSHSRRHRKRRRANHPSSLPRNPTLAEAGGLPPLRPEDEQPPPKPAAS